MVVLLGLSSALMFGLLDIFIAQAARSLGMMYTLVLAHATAALILLFYLFAHTSSIIGGISFTSLPLLLCIGGGLGLVSCLTNLSLYKGLSLGPIALISPVIASYGLITMLLAALFLRDIPSPQVSMVLALIVGGMLLAVSASKKETQRQSQVTWSRPLLIQSSLALAISLFTAGVLFVLLWWLELDLWFLLFCCLCEAICVFLACCLTFVPSFTQLHSWWASNRQQSGLLFGIGAMLGFGVEYFLLSLATAHLGPVHPVVVSRLCSALLLFAYARHQQIQGWGEIKLKHFSLIFLIGLFDVLGTISYNVGSSQSTVLVAALSSTYPLLPFLMGVVWYQERISFVQWGGVGAMILGMVGLSLLGK